MDDVSAVCKFVAQIDERVIVATVYENDKAAAIYAGIHFPLVVQRKLYNMQFYFTDAINSGQGAYKLVC